MNIVITKIDRLLSEILKRRRGETMWKQHISGRRGLFVDDILITTIGVIEQKWGVDPPLFDLSNSVLKI